MSARLQLAAAQMPADKYTERPTASERSFGETVAFTANVSGLYCAHLTGRKDVSGYADGDQPKDTLVMRLRAHLSFCRDALADLTDDALGEIVPFNGLKTRAAVISEATGFWAEQYEHMVGVMRRHGQIPPVPCTGASGQVHTPVPCASGWNECSSRSIGSGQKVTASLGDSPYSVRGDGRGVYREEEANVLTVSVGGLILADAFTPPNQRRAIVVDLDHPVPGDVGVRRGVVRDDNDLSIQAQWESDSTHRMRNLREIPIGGRVQAGQIGVEFHIGAVVYVLQAGPLPVGHCLTDQTAVYGAGTTQGTITRSDSTTWIVDLAPGSIGRLFDISRRFPYAENKGLYQMSLRFVLRSDK